MFTPGGGPIAIDYSYLSCLFLLLGSLINHTILLRIKVFVWYCVSLVIYLITLGSPRSAVTVNVIYCLLIAADDIVMVR